ncbi:MAG TPA: NAD(P)-binding domain-containing protein, partial [Thermoanaerobaculia bacterium]
AADGDFLVRTRRTSGEREWRAKHLVLAIGDMHRPRRIDVPGEDLPHVSHYFEDPHVYFHRRVLIVGGRNSAVEAAIRCVRVGAAVTLAYRGAELDETHIKFWLLPEIRAMIRGRRMTFLPKTAVCEIRTDRVTLARTEGGDRFDLEADAVLLLTGYEQDPDLFEQAGVTLVGSNRRPLVDERTMETNVPRLYVAGTAAAGTQSSGVREFLETTHIHIDRIVAAITGGTPPENAIAYEMPES